MDVVVDLLGTLLCCPPSASVSCSASGLRIVVVVVYDVHQPEKNEFMFYIPVPTIL